MRTVRFLIGDEDKRSMNLFLGLDRINSRHLLDVLTYFLHLNLHTALIAKTAGECECVKTLNSIMLYW